MAWIEKREGIKKTSYRVHYKDRFTGRKRNKSFGLRKQAQAFLENVGSQENAITHSDGKATVITAIDRWLTLSTTTGRGGREPIERSTAMQYANHARVLTELIGGLRLSEITTQVCEELRDNLLRRFSRPYAKKFLSSFKSILNQAVRDGLILKNPAQDVFILISSRQRKANRIKIPELWEVQKLTDNIDALMVSSDAKTRKAWERFGPMFYTQLYSGMRPTEVRGLAWKNVDWEQSCLHLTQDADQFGEIGLLKSGAAYRTIPLPEFVMEMLNAWESACPKGEHDLVFPNGNGNVENHANIHRRGWYVLCRRAGFMDRDKDGKESVRYPLNTLRHLKASLEIALKRPPKRIQELMGHEDIKLTFDTYGHLFKNEALQDNPNDITKLIASGASLSKNGCQMGARKKLNT